MPKLCAQLVQKLSEQGVVIGARLYTFIIQCTLKGIYEVEQLLVIPSYVRVVLTRLYTAIFSNSHLLNDTYAPNPHPLLILTKKI